MPRPKTKPDVERSSQKGAKEGEERVTILSKSQHIEDMKNIAYWSRKKIKDAYDNALTLFIEQWKKDPSNKSYVSGGKIKQRPEGE